ncbi:MAG: hypothetical protein HYZ25_12220 [Chloroflexi bacterium]|nr:hypothetical protein [Chloroflexota bacterium]
MKLNRLLIAILLLTTACNLPLGASPAPTEAVTAPATEPSVHATDVPSFGVPQVEQATPVPQPINASVVTDPQFNTLHMLTELDGWALSDKAILRTNDGGSTWYDVTPPGVYPLGYGVSADFLDASRAFFVAPDSADPMHAGALYRTADGGLTWSMNAVPFGGGVLDFLDTSNGWAMAGLGVGAGSNAIAIFQTADGGATWTQVFINDPNDPNARTDIPLGGLKGVFYARDMQTAWVGGIVYSDATLYLYRTDDGGRTWAQVSAELPSAAQQAQVSVEEIQFLAPADGFLTLSFTSQAGLTRALYVTHDGGNTWTLTPTLIPNGRSVDFVSPADGLMFDGQQFYVTRDAGSTWGIVKPDVVFADSFMSMDFVNPTTGWLLASDPTTFKANLYKTTDGGATWTPQ